MARPSFFFYDLETSGLSSADDRIMQFAGQRTNLDLKPIGDPYNILVKLPDDTLPSPGAILTTKITPQETQSDGILESELSKTLAEEVIRPDTIIVGFNSVRFGDKFIQHLFWRNFYDPYEWQWRDGRSRWDMLDVVRMTRALRPEGINWPVTDDGKPTNRLELITKLNGISHESAHDALSDVNALIGVTNLISKKQPKLFEFLFKMRDKREVKALINLNHPQPFVCTSGRYGSEFNFTTVVYPLFLTKKGNIVVYDLRINPTELISTAKDNPKALHPTVKELAPNRCPAVAPLGVLDQSAGWDKLSLTRKQIDTNLQLLRSNPSFIKSLRAVYESDTYDKQPVDVEASLYDSFIPDTDKVRLAAIRTGTADSLADFHPNFADERLSELLLHYKAKNFPTSLSEAETVKWSNYRTARLKRQEPYFISEMERLSKDSSVTSSPEKQFLLQELYLWYQSLRDSDY